MCVCVCVAPGNLTGESQGAGRAGFKQKITPGYHSDPPNTSAYHQAAVRTASSEAEKQKTAAVTHPNTAPHTKQALH